MADHTKNALNFILDHNNKAILTNNLFLPVLYKACMDKLFTIFRQNEEGLKNLQSSNHPGPAPTQTQSQSSDLPELFSEEFY